MCMDICLGDRIIVSCNGHWIVRLKEEREINENLLMAGGGRVCDHLFEERG